MGKSQFSLFDYQWDDEISVFSRLNSFFWQRENFHSKARKRERQTEHFIVLFAPKVKNFKDNSQEKKRIKNFSWNIISIVKILQVKNNCDWIFLKFNYFYSPSMVEQSEGGNCNDSDEMDENAEAMSKSHAAVILNLSCETCFHRTVLFFRYYKNSIIGKLMINMPPQLTLIFLFFF